MRAVWLAPGAWWLGVLVAVPIAVHLLARRRRDRRRFPTLRFLDEASAPARRRWHLRDLALLAVRVGLIAAIAAALAGPVLVTATRQAAWDAQVARAVVTVPATAASPAVAAAELADGPGVTRRIVADDLRQGLADAAAWLSAEGRTRREVVVVAPMARGSLSAADVRAVPADIGVRVVPAGVAAPATRQRTRVQLTGDRLWRVTDEVTLAEATTTVREVARVPEAGRGVETRAVTAGSAANGGATAGANSGAASGADAARRAVLRRGVVLPTPGGGVTAPWTGDVQVFAQALDAAAPGDAGGEPQPLSGDELRALSRPSVPAAPAEPRDAGDRRVAWGAVLVLLALETWARKGPA